MSIPSNPASERRGRHNIRDHGIQPTGAIDAGMDYMAVVQCFGNARVSTNGSSPAQTSFIFYDNGTGPDWYYTTQTPMVRMVVGQNFNVGLEDASESAGTSLGQNMPNPTRDQTNITTRSRTLRR